MKSPVLREIGLRPIRPGADGKYGQLRCSFEGCVEMIEMKTSDRLNPITGNRFMVIPATWIATIDTEPGVLHVLCPGHRGGAQ